MDGWSGLVRVPRRRPRLLAAACAFTVIGVLAAASSALAGPVDGRLAVSPVGTQQLQLSISVQHACPPGAYCGWFAVIDQRTPSEGCPAASPANPLWVSPISEAPSGDFTAVVEPYGWFDGAEPIRLCLVVSHESGYQTVFDLVYTPPEPPPPPPPPPPAPPAPSAHPAPPVAIPEPLPTLTGAEARRFASAALRRRFGRRYTRRRDFRMTCTRLSRRRFRCRVSWQHRGRYAGTVTVWLSVEDDTEFVDSTVNVRYRRPAPPPTKRSEPRRPSPSPSPSPAPRRDCDPSYPGVCIESPPPDLDCPEVPYEDFRVRGRDPHGFDGDNDGVGCES